MSYVLLPLFDIIPYNIFCLFNGNDKRESEKAYLLSDIKKESSDDHKVSRIN